MILSMLIFFLGLIIGSFLNVVVLRLKANEQFAQGRSKCPNCGHCLCFWDLIPVLSFVFLGGKCRYCKAKISWQYPLVELATAIVFLIGCYHYNLQFLIHNFHSIFNSQFLNYIIYLVFSCFLIVIFAYDLKYYLILDKICLTAFFLAMAVNLLIGKNLWNLLFASLIIGGFLAMIFFISGGKWMGGGDMRLGLLAGALLGWPNALTAFYIACLTGAVWGLILIAAKKKNLKSQLPFGTFFSLSIWLLMLWGQKLTDLFFPKIF